MNSDKPFIIIIVCLHMQVCTLFAAYATQQCHEAVAP